MRLETPSPKWLALLVLILIPALAWALVRPVRVVLPSMGSGVVCVNASVCVDDLTQAEHAKALYAQAQAFVSSRLGAVQGEPRLIFCATTACAEFFGLGERAALTMGSYGTVIGPRAWEPDYVRHELIHFLQYQHLGIARVLLSPAWFVEGMAYGLSEDPRQPLHEPFESYRRRFAAWYGLTGPAALWRDAAEL